MKTIIKVGNLSKRYRLGLKEKQSDTLVGQVSNIIKSPFQNFKRLRNLSRFNLQDDSVFWALKDISFDVKEGEVLGIIGKNGAGKSTLLKILSGITDPTDGRIVIHGRVASLLEVGTGFHPELSGRENIYMNGTILGMTRREIDSKLDEIIDFSGVEKFIDTPVKFYSSGMKVRLGFSVAAHLDPEILIIDEVLAVGDYEFQKKCLGKMDNITKNQGRTVLFVSHNMSAVENICNEIILIDRGEIKLKGKAKHVLDYYSNNQVIIFNNKNSKQGFSIKVNENSTLLMKTGDDFFLSLVLEMESPQENLSLAIGINKNHSRVFTLNSLYQTGRYFKSNGVGVINIYSFKLPLAVGTYDIVSTLYQQNEKLVEFDVIGRLTIVESDFFKTGKKINSKFQGSVLFKSKWEISL